MGRGERRGGGKRRWSGGEVEQRCEVKGRDEGRSKRRGEQGWESGRIRKEKAMDRILI